MRLRILVLLVVVPLALALGGCQRDAKVTTDVRAEPTKEQRDAAPKLPSASGIYDQVTLGMTADAVTSFAGEPRIEPGPEVSFGDYYIYEDEADQGGKIAKINVRDGKVFSVELIGGQGADKGKVLESKSAEKTITQ